MVSDQYATLLEELGKALGNITLQPDKYNTCLIKMAQGVKISVEMDKTGQFILLGSKLGEVPPGKYRENLFREALKANCLAYPVVGILSYSQKTNQLLLFHKLLIDELTGAKIASVIKPFVDKASKWAKALEQGNIPDIEEEGSEKRTAGSGMFGLH